MHYTRKTLHTGKDNKFPKGSRSADEPGKHSLKSCKNPGITEKTCYCWRKEYGGMRINRKKRLKELEKENARLKRPAAASTKYNISERSACRAIRQYRSTQRYEVRKLAYEDELTVRIINLVAQYGRYGTPG